MWYPTYSAVIITRRKACQGSITLDADCMEELGPILTGDLLVCVLQVETALHPPDRLSDGLPLV